MKTFKILFTKQALKDLKKLSPKLQTKLKGLLRIISENPYVGEKLYLDLEGHYSYRLNIKDRIVYIIDKAKKTIYIKRLRTHYGE